MTTRLRYALLVCFALGCLGVVAAEAELIPYTGFLYLAAENLLAVSIVIVIALALTLKDLPAEPARISQPATIAVITGILSAGSSLALVMIYGGAFLIYEALIALLMGVAVGAVSYAILSDVSDLRMAGVAVSPRLFIGLIVLLGITILVRLIAPGSGVLTFVFAPLLYFLLPGLALTFTLLPPDSRPLDHLVYAAPISIGAQFILVAWFVQLGVALTPLLIFVNASAITLIGFALALVRQRKR